MERSIKLCLLQKLEILWVYLWAAQCCSLYKSYDIKNSFKKRQTYRCCKSFIMVCSCTVFITHTRALAEDTSIILSLSSRGPGLLSVLVHGEIVPQKWFGNSVNFFVVFFASIQKEACLCESFKAFLKYLLWCFLSTLCCAQYANACGVHTVRSNHRKNMQIWWSVVLLLFDLWHGPVSVLTNSCLARDEVNIYNGIAF